MTKFIRGPKNPLRNAGLVLVLALAACPNAVNDPAGSDDPAGIPLLGDDWRQGNMAETTAKNIFDYAPCEGGIRIIRLKSVPALTLYLGVPVPENGRTGEVPPDRTFTIKTIAGKPVAEIAGGTFAAAPENDISSLVRTIVLPDTITALGPDLFFGVENPVVVQIPAALISVLGETALMVAAGDSAGIQILGAVPSNPSDPEPPPVVIVHRRPALWKSAVTYNSSTGAVSVTIVFDMAVTDVQTEGWDLAVDGPVISSVPRNPVPGIPARITLTAANPEDTGKITVVTVECMPVTGVFDRASLSGGVYRLLYYDENNAAGLEDGEGNTHWYYVPVEDTTRDLFNVIYRPNVPGKEATGAAVLGLFNIRFGPDPSGDRVEIRGVPPAAADTSIVIDLGIPGEDNSGLVPFFIPDRALGRMEDDYAHIRFRVNRGIYLVIEADNSGYEEHGAGNPCPSGNLTGGTVEIMGGGRLRDGAYEGFPLGKDTTIIVRLGSWLAVGPERASNSFAPGHERDRWYEGWLVGPAAADPRILWGAGDQNGGYIEAREGRLVFDANLTVRKSLALDCDVWFAKGPTLTIDAAEDELTIGGERGLFARNSGYNFYGTKSGSGGQNPSHESAKIVVKRGSAISRSFLTGNTEEEAPPVIRAEDTDIIIRNQGKGSPPSPLVTYNGGSIYGYRNWGF